MFVVCVLLLLFVIVVVGCSRCLFLLLSKYVSRVVAVCVCFVCGRNCCCVCWCRVSLVLLFVCNVVCVWCY